MPIIKTAKQFPSSTQAYKPTDKLPYLAWWEQFKDPELNNLIQCGLSNNADIHIALGHLEQARGELSQVKLSWLPNLEVLAGYSTNPALGIPGAFIGAWPIYLINIAKQMKSQERAKYQLEYVNAMMEGVRLSIIGQVAASYFTLIALEEQLSLLNTLHNDMKKLTTLARKDIVIGLKNKVDLAPYLVDDSQISAEITLIENDLVITQNALRFLINTNPGKIKNKPNFSSINFNSIKPGSLPATVLQNRPDLKMAEYALRRSYAGVTIAYSNFFPSLQLDQFIGEGNHPTNTLEEMTDSYLTWTISPSTFGQIKARKGAYKAETAKFIKKTYEILKEVDNDFSTNNKVTAFYFDMEKAKSDYQKKYILQQGLLKNGLISYKDLLSSKIALDKLAITQNQAKLKLALSLVTLYQDLAGGYKNSA